MVLDNYRQAYIGQSWDMRKRIKKHWSWTKQFDRLLWGRVQESVMSIDSFRTLDTTRIVASRTINYDSLEAHLVRTFPRTICSTAPEAAPSRACAGCS